MTIDIKFWGVRGSVPAPLTPAQVEAKVRTAVAKLAPALPMGEVKRIYEQAVLSSPGSGVVINRDVLVELTRAYDPSLLSFAELSTFGGNTTCVEVKCSGKSEHQFILDMGTGVRELGKEMMPKAFKYKGLRGTILQSHVHWDHIQGFPFWGPLYLPRTKFDCQFDFFGGKQWDSKLDAVYRGQMDAPYFPVNLEELETSAMRMTFNTIWDEWTKTWFAHTDEKGRPEFIKAIARKLQHPQETFGYRIEFMNHVVAFTTDHEPYAAGVPRGLAELVNGADVWITDCQYSHDEYIGGRGPQKMGWGHSFPEYIAEVAKQTGPKLIVTTHHDPDASDERIIDLARQVQDGCNIETRPAYEGMLVSL